MRPDKFDPIDLDQDQADDAPPLSGGGRVAVLATGVAAAVAAVWATGATIALQQHDTSPAAVTATVTATATATATVTPTPRTPPRVYVVQAGARGRPATVQCPDVIPFVPGYPLGPSEAPTARVCGKVHHIDVPTDGVMLPVPCPPGSTWTPGRRIGPARTCGTPATFQPVPTQPGSNS